MKYAFIHDRIFHIGGAEAVFFDLIEEKIKGEEPKSDSSQHSIYCLFSDKKSLSVANRNISVIVALPRWINDIFVYFSQKHVPIFSKIFDYRNLIVIYPLLTNLLRKKVLKTQPDHITISSFSTVKNIIPANAKLGDLKSEVLLYLHSPMQYIRENYDEYVNKLPKRQLAIFKPLTKRLRKRDMLERTYDTVYTNSHYTAYCAKKYYKLEAHVRYPHINENILATPPASKPHTYYLYIGRLVKFIREADRIIHLFNKLQLPLLVMGSGPDELYLKSIAGPTITFIGKVTDVEQKIEIIKHAKGLVNLTKESCGMATMEALALGVPIFGYNGGATPELVDEDSGMLVEQKENISQLAEDFHRFAQQNYNKNNIKKRFLEKYNFSLQSK